MNRPTLALMTALCLTACSESSETPPVQRVMEELEARFRSEREAVFADAVWISPTTFSVSVEDNGANRDGLAVYVCDKLHARGLREGYAVEVVDNMSQDAPRQVLGSARCGVQAESSI
jgi:hypothetical protein